MPSTIFWMPSTISWPLFFFSMVPSQFCTAVYRHYWDRTAIHTRFPKVSHFSGVFKMPITWRIFKRGPRSQPGVGLDFFLITRRNSAQAEIQTFGVNFSKSQQLVTAAACLQRGLSRAAVLARAEILQYDYMKNFSPFHRAKNSIPVGANRSWKFGPAGIQPGLKRVLRVKKRKRFTFLRVNHQCSIEIVCSL